MTAPNVDERPRAQTPDADPYTLADPRQRLLSHRPSLREMFAEWTVLGLLALTVITGVALGAYFLKSAVGFDIFPTAHAKSLWE